MYSEKTFKNYIFWVQVKRAVIIIVLSCLGAALGVLIGKLLESLMQITSFNNVIIIVSTITFFLLSLLLTVGTGEKVQEGYWKIAVLRKLTVIQKDLELNNQLLKNNDKAIRTNTSSNTNDTEDTEFEDDEESGENENSEKKKPTKKLKLVK